MSVVTMFYGCAFAVSVICSAIYIYMWHRYFDVNFTVIFALVPVTCIGYFLSGLATTVEEVVMAVKITYVGGSFLQLFMLYSILNLCRIQVGKWVKVTLFAICAAVYSSALTIGYSDIFYKSASLEIVDGVAVINKEYGPLHTVFYVTIFLFFVAGVVAICYTWARKKQVPRTIIYLLLMSDIICLLGFFGGRMIYNRVDLVVAGFVLTQIIFIIIANRVSLYNIGATVVESMVREQGVGYISFDTRYRYLGSNRVAREIVTELESMTVDDVLEGDLSSVRLRHFIDEFEENPSDDLLLNTYEYVKRSPDGDSKKDKIYNVNVNYLYVGRRKRGYIVTFQDDTADKKYIQLLDTYAEKLQEEVDVKTNHIVEMHDNLIMSLAMMVESRDNSTGGHIKRTSEGVRILIDEIKEEDSYELSEEFCRDVIKAAPMHDLGKIAVDDAVLRKPGRFTDEEYEKMKHHAEEGARVIHEILLNTDDDSFKVIAENVAHYHHERWDGSGYPERLSGEQIPFEARIMAIADVYDALVSKRVYKEAYDFEKANSIIMEGMGTQFDPGLQKIYENSRERLEEYYRSQE